MYTNNRNAYRQTFFVTWQKYKKNLELQPVESDLIQIILKHPEYHLLLENEKLEQQEFSLDENPFFHMSLHLAVHDQLRTNRPENIVSIYQQLKQKNGDPHKVEHLMMTCLAQILWRAQERNGVPNEKEYLDALRELI